MIQIQDMQQQNTEGRGGGDNMSPYTRESAAFHTVGPCYYPGQKNGHYDYA